MSELSAPPRKRRTPTRSTNQRPRKQRVPTLGIASTSPEQSTIGTFLIISMFGVTHAIYIGFGFCEFFYKIEF